MILIAHEKGSKELLPYIQRIGVKAEISQIPYGDFYFEGNGPTGRIDIGVERKTLHDMLHCIEDHRFVGHQKIGMKRFYDLQFLMMEGTWRPHDPEGWLMEFFPSSQKWGFCNPGGRRVLYSKLRRYLFSISMSEVKVLYSRDMWQTAYDICELYHYFSKAWDKHTSLKEMHRIALPDMNTRPRLVRRWAGELEGIGVELSERAAAHFKTPVRLATADEIAWLGVEGVGPKTARRIVKEVQGWA